VTARLIGGSFAGCPVVHPKKKPRHGARIAAHRKSPHAVVRQLWGNAHGAFTTRGRYGAAAVRGTIWLTQDRCDGTYFHVTKDSITVTAYAHPKKHRLLPQGHHYLVAAGG
jgi:hypothetical protein